MPQLIIPDFAPQLIWLVITFTFLYIMMSRVALPRIADVLEQRRDRIQRDLDEAQRLKSETEKAISDYEQALAEARANASAIAKENRDKLEAEIAKERESVEARIAEETAAAESKITAAKQAALAEVGKIGAETAESLVASLIGQSASSDEIQAAIARATQK